MIRSIAFSSALLLSIVHIKAQAGSLDLDFNGSGSVIAQEGSDAQGLALQVQADGVLSEAG